MTPGYKYAMLCNGDCSYPPNYARTIIDRMEACPDIAIASGRISGGSIVGAGGRFIRQQFFYDNYDGRWPKIVGYETEVLYRARHCGYRVDICDVEYTHHGQIGNRNSVAEWGCGSRSLGQHPLLVLYSYGKNLLRGLSDDAIQYACSIVTSHTNHRNADI